MESMTNSFKADFDALLKERELDKFSTFSQSTFYDEFPLYARLSEIAFLSHLSIESANSALLVFALEYLQRLTTHISLKTPFFAAVTVWKGDDPTDPIVPRILICNDVKVHDLKNSLRLTSVNNTFAKSIDRLVNEVSPGTYNVFRDVGIPTTMGVRVVAGPKSVLNKQQLPVTHFCVSTSVKTLKSARSGQVKSFRSTSKSSRTQHVLGRAAEERRVRPEYIEVAKKLRKGWPGTYVELARALGKPTGYARTIARIDHSLKRTKSRKKNETGR